MGARLRRKRLAPGAGTFHHLRQRLARSYPRFTSDMGLSKCCRSRRATRRLAELVDLRARKAGGVQFRFEMRRFVNGTRVSAYGGMATAMCRQIPAVLPGRGAAV